MFVRVPPAAGSHLGQECGGRVQEYKCTASVQCVLCTPRCTRYCVYCTAFYTSRRTCTLHVSFYTLVYEIYITMKLYGCTTFHFIPFHIFPILQSRCSHMAFVHNVQSTIWPCHACTNYLLYHVVLYHVPCTLYKLYILDPVKNDT